MSKLPDGWERVTIGYVGIIKTGNTPPTKQVDNYGGLIPFVKPGDLGTNLPIINTEQTLSEKGGQQARILRCGAILVSCIGNLGKVGIAGVPLATNQQINSIEFDLASVDDRFGYHYCKTLQAWMEDEASATTVTILNKGKFSKAPFILPPLNEQKRIADKLDALLARVDACRERLDRVLAILKRFRQAVLAAATSGELIEEWREKNHAANWKHVSIHEIASALFDGPFGSNLKSDDYSVSGVRVVRLENIGWLNFILEKETFITSKKYEDLRRNTLKPRDILFSSFISENIRVCLFPKNLSTAAINKADCFCVRTNTQECLPEFLVLRLACRSTFKLFENKIHGATRPRINIKQLKEFDFNLPSLEEQSEIIRRVEILFAYADRLEARYTAARAQLDRLTPALLAKAFRGELVPQDPDDEPAAVLLERIRAARVTEPKKQRQPRSPKTPRPKTAKTI